MMIPIGDIRENGNLRRVKASAEADAALVASIRAQGVLQPVLVRPGPDGTRGFVLVAGHRRLACARIAGLSEIPAEAIQVTDGWAMAAQAAENMVRVAMHPVDQWRAVRDLVAGGFTFANAADALGLDDRQTRRMERLGMLDPKLLALIEAADTMPTDYYLRTIANAPRELQAKAANNKAAMEDRDGRTTVNWHIIAGSCHVRRFSRAAAIFDHASMAWDTDLFAQPGSDDEYTTTDGVTFLALQEAALESLVADARAKKQRMQMAAFSERTHGAELPAGFVCSYGGNPEKPKRFECVFVAIHPDRGEIVRTVGEDTKAAKAKTLARSGVVGDSDDDPDDGDDDGVEDDRTEAPAAVAVDKPGLTKTGLAMVAAAKTSALRDTLRTGLSEVDPLRLLALMLLVWCARNVRVFGDLSHDGDLSAIAAGLLLPGGQLDAGSLASLRDRAGEVLARVLVFRAEETSYAPSSGAAADWIGAAIGADHALPRFDTAEFLAQVSGDELRRAAEAIGEKSTGTVKSLRDRLTGAMPHWRPAAAAFGAPAPAMEARGGARRDEDLEDAA